MSIIDLPSKPMQERSWTVIVSKAVEKRLRKLPLIVRQQIMTLVHEIEKRGPIRGNWRNYSKLGENQHHCHLKSGRPTYVACWEVIDKTVRLVEVYYVGTHEKAPY